VDNDLDKETRLGMLASAILDGTPIDWPAAKSTGDAVDQDVVRQLQIVAEIAALHRNLDPTRSSAPSALQDLDATRPAIAWGHLRLLEPVGRGTFGEVYRAWDTHLDREVALKLLRAGPVTGDPSASLSDPARAVNEGRLLAKVRHPNVITVYGAEPRDGRVGIWMEFIRGKTLDQIVEQQGAFGARETATVGIDLCHALAAVHRAGLLHRDMTARNVMREEGGRVVLMDFGAGHEYSAASSARSDATGTPLYMAPELFTGGLADQRTDIYALAVLLYYLVTRSFPVTGRSLAAIGEAHARGERARLRDVRPDLPAAFVRAVEQATAADPAQRFATAGDLEAALDTAMRGAPVTSIIAPSAGRWRLAIAATALAVVGLATTWVFRDGLLGGGGGNAAAARNAVAGTVFTARKLSLPAGVSVMSNPSDDGRYVAAMVNETGDAAIVDLTTATYRPLGIVNAEGTNGYASITTISPDGKNIAVSWYLGYKGALHVIRADGSGHRVLIDDIDFNVYQWSRDGSLILTAIANPDGTNSICLVAATDGAVRRVHTLGTEWPDMMTLSPDGRYVAYDYPQPGSFKDRDIFVLDTHTGAQWPVAASPAQDMSPLWSPDGRGLVFFSDRNRQNSAWMVEMQNGRSRAEARLLKHDVGRIWPRGFTRDGTLYYQLNVGFAEVYIGAIDGSSPSPQPVSPRQALSNYYPAWSRDGRFIAYTSERRADGPREIWLYDTTTGQEQRVPAEQKLGRPWAWSPDDRQLLVFGQNDGRLFILDLISGKTKLVSTLARKGRWLSEGIVFIRDKTVVLQDPDSGRQIRRLDFSDPGIVMFDVDQTGRTAPALWKNGRMTLTDVLTGTTREWTEPGVNRIGFQAAAGRSSTLAYTALGKDSAGSWVALKVESGTGHARELLRARGERIVVWGWTGDGKSVLVTRWPESSPESPEPIRPTTLWRVPVDGGAPISTGIVAEGVRDLSIHPDGQRIAFNAGWRINEPWAMDNLLAR
jgi:eukaryotic-like serine/threonine-protein kinase